MVIGVEPTTIKNQTQTLKINPIRCIICGMTDKKRIKSVLFDPLKKEINKRRKRILFKRFNFQFFDNSVA